jgi:hypothetical protein
MDQALEEESEKHALTIDGDVDAGAVGGTVIGMAASAPATVAAVVNPIAEEEEGDEVFPFDSEADLLQHPNAKNLKAIFAPPQAAAGRNYRRGLLREIKV